MYDLIVQGDFSTLDGFVEHVEIPHPRAVDHRVEVRINIALKGATCRIARGPEITLCHFQLGVSLHAAIMEGGSSL